MAETITLRKAEVLNPPPLAWGDEANAQSWKVGEFLYWVSGELTVCASDATAVCGIAASDASGTRYTARPFYPIDSNTVIKANVYHGSGASSAATVRTLIGVKYALYVGSNLHHVDIADTGHDFFVIQEIAPDDVVGDYQGRVYARILPAVIQSEAAAT